MGIGARLTEETVAAAAAAALEALRPMRPPLNGSATAAAAAAYPRAARHSQARLDSSCGGAAASAPRRRSFSAPSSPRGNDTLALPPALQRAASATAGARAPSECGSSNSSGTGGGANCTAPNARGRMYEDSWASCEVGLEQHGSADSWGVQPCFAAPARDGGHDSDAANAYNSAPLPRLHHAASGVSAPLPSLHECGPSFSGSWAMHRALPGVMMPLTPPPGAAAPHSPPRCAPQAVHHSGVMVLMPAAPAHTSAPVIAAAACTAMPMPPRTYYMHLAPTYSHLLPAAQPGVPVYYAPVSGPPAGKHHWSVPAPAAAAPAGARPTTSFGRKGELGTGVFLPNASIIKQQQQQQEEKQA